MGRVETSASPLALVTRVLVATLYCRVEVLQRQQQDPSDSQQEAVQPVQVVRSTSRPVQPAQKHQAETSILAQLMPRALVS